MNPLLQMLPLYYYIITHQHQPKSYLHEDVRRQGRCARCAEGCGPGSHAVVLQQAWRGPVLRPRLLCLRPGVLTGIPNLHHLWHRGEQTKLPIQWFYQLFFIQKRTKHSCFKGALYVRNGLISHYYMWCMSTMVESGWLPVHTGLSWVENFEKPENCNWTIFLHNWIVKCGVICHEKPELQACAWKLAPMDYGVDDYMWVFVDRGVKRVKVRTSSSSDSEICGAGSTSLLRFFTGSWKLKHTNRYG